MGRTESQANFMTSTVKDEPVDQCTVQDSYKVGHSDDSCSRGWLHMVGRRPPHLSHREVDSYRRREERSVTDTRLGLPLSEIRVNQRGEPYGESETLVSDQLRLIVRKYVPVTTMWASVSKEVRYKIVQEVQSSFRDGRIIESSWIKMKAGKLLASDRGRAKTILWRKHSSLFETCI